MNGSASARWDEECHRKEGLTTDPDTLAQANDSTLYTDSGWSGVESRNTTQLRLCEGVWLHLARTFVEALTEPQLLEDLLCLGCISGCCDHSPSLLHKLHGM